jgi:hypothetical protein
MNSTYVGAANDDLRPCALAKSTTSECRSDCVLKIAMGVEGDGIRGEEPYEMPVAEHKLSAANECESAARHDLISGRRFYQDHSTHKSLNPIQTLYK